MRERELGIELVEEGAVRGRDAGEEEEKDAGEGEKKKGKEKIGSRDPIAKEKGPESKVEGPG